ncbi:MAG TPA: transposase [Chromatiaceae bacterium]|nr:transposase [Chromatiaceae bacterium]
MNAVAKIEGIKSRTGLCYTQLLPQAGIGYRRFMRFKRRIVAGHPPLKAPGPKKVESFDFGKLTQKIGTLEHGQKRTRGTGNLYRSYKDVISRREFNQLVIAVRRDHQRDRSAALKQVIWKRPDVVWALDGTEYKAGFADRKLHIQNLQDLCSAYKFTPLATGQTPLGEQIAGHLDNQFARYGPPMFIKRDNGGNLNHLAVNQLLEDAMVVPINSPVRTPPYNGAVERAQGELKQYLDCWHDKAKTIGELGLLAETAVHDLNHKPRRRLGGKIACRVYFGDKRIRYNKRERRSVFEWIENLASDISQRAGYDVITILAWRVAAKTWLMKNGLVEILNPQKAAC